MPDYALGKIYKIISDQTDQMYVGSTAQKLLSHRMGEHKKDYMKSAKGNCKISSQEIIKFDDARIILIESFPCTSRDELRAREQYWLDIHHTLSVNKQKAHVGDDKEAYYAQQKKQNHIANKEKYNKISREYHEVHREELKIASKAYYTVHKDTFKQKSKQNYINEKEHLSSKMTCDCGLEMSVSSYARHRKTKFHRNFVEQSELKPDVLVNGDDQRDSE